MKKKVKATEKKNGLQRTRIAGTCGIKERRKDTLGDNTTRHQTMPPTSKRCQFCQKTFNTQRGVSQHISASIICLNEWHKNIVKKDDNPSPKRRRINSPEPSFLDEELPYPNPTLDFDAADNRADVEEVDDDSDNIDQATPKRYVEPFPGPAGDALRQEKTRFEILEGVQQMEGKTSWEPFASRAEWQLAEWLMKNVRQKAIDEYLQLPIVSWHLCSIKITHIFKGKQ